MSYSYRETLIGHPNLAPAMVRLTSRRFGSRIVAGLARAMAMDGVPAGLIPTVLNSFEIYVFGAGVSAKGDYEKPRPATLPELDDFPEVADALLTPQDDEASFREGLQALITGWQSRIASLQQR
jgi:hypothetical protein